MNSKPGVYVTRRRGDHGSGEGMGQLVDRTWFSGLELAGVWDSPRID